MRIAVLADTHIPKRAKSLPEAALEVIRSADVIVHAGDILTNQFLQALNTMAPVYAVLGNNDLDVVLPERLELTWEGVCFGLVHDSGPAKGRAKRLRKLFPEADVVIFGHSHIPWNEQVGDLLLFNPGSATDKRKQPNLTMGLIECSNGTVTAEIVLL